MIVQVFWLRKSTNPKLRKLEKGAGRENYSVLPCLHHCITVPVNKDQIQWEKIPPLLENFRCRGHQGSIHGQKMCSELH